MHKALILALLIATPAHAQTVPTDCSAGNAAAVAWYRLWFDARKAVPWATPGPDDGILGNPGVMSLACFIVRGSPVVTASGPTYDDGFKVGVAAAAALAATAKQGGR